MLRNLIQALPSIAQLAHNPNRVNEPWKHQRVVEGPFTFDRVWLNTANKRRIALHAHERGEGALFWHPHCRPIAVIAVGHYELSIGMQPFGETLVARQARIAVNGAFGYELTGNSSWHAVRCHGPTESIVMFGNDTDKTDEEPIEADYAAAIELVKKIRPCIARVKAYEEEQRIIFDRD